MKALDLTGMNGLARYWVASLDLEGRVKVLWESEGTWANRAIPSPDDRSVVFQAARLRGSVRWLDTTSPEKLSGLVSSYL